jgi:vanillate O-demethylase monooxygenase subunit
MEKPLREAWYAVLWSDDLTRSLHSRVVLNTLILLFRKENGDPAALLDVCPHRCAPLSRGKLKGDEVECGYHGLVFDGNGRCTANPHGGIPKAAQVRRFPVLDRYGVIWIWTGNPHRADPAALPNYSYLNDDNHRTLKDSLNIKASYELVVDNLMDASHAQYVHAGFFKTEAAQNVRQKTWRDKNTIHNHYITPSRSVPPSFAGFLPSEVKVVDYYIEFRWEPPSLLSNTTAVVAAGRPREEAVEKIGTHLVTPETETTCQYFFAHSRTFAQGDATVDRNISNWQRTGFQEQDEPMIEAVQQVRHRFPELTQNPVLLSIDAGPVQVQRVLQELRKLEEA